MPEGPEVFVITKQLNQNCSNWELKKIDLVSGPHITSQLTNFKTFRRNVKAFNLLAESESVVISKVLCKGKYIYFELTITKNNVKQYRYLVNHLGMAACWTLEEGNHTAVVLELEQDGLSKYVYFDDEQHFGKFYLLNTAQMEALLKKLGPSVLAKSFTLELFLLRAKLYAKMRPNQTICLLLLDQSFVSGIGNYLRSDILYVAKIYPFRQLKDMTNEDWIGVYHATIDRIKASIKAGGTTIENYYDMNGEEGKYDTLVYDKDVDANNNKVKPEADREGKNARTIHWVPKVQKYR